MNQIIPLSGGSVNAHQTFDIQLGDVFATFTLDYRTLTELWSMRITVGGVDIVKGAVLRVGCDVIKNWQISETMGYLIMVGDEVTLDNLGTSNNLVWVPYE